MPTIRNVIFAGGGSRCFWQLGCWDGLRQAGMPLDESVVMFGATSAGCAMAVAASTGRTREALGLFQDLTRRNPANVHWRNLLRPGTPVLPHARMYRGALEAFIGAGELARMHMKTVRFLMSDFPQALGGPLGALVGFAVYAAEKRLRDPVHPQWGRLAGFRPVVGEVSRCQTAAEVVDLAMAASCVPPVLPGGRHDGRPVLDGGLVDNVPLVLAEGEPGHTLVLLSKRYSGPLPTRAATTYLQPSAAIRIDKFDYANPEGLQDAYDLGLADGVRAAAGLADAVEP